MAGKRSTVREYVEAALWALVLTLFLRALEIHNKQVEVDGQKLREPYAVHKDPSIRPPGYDFRDNFGPTTIPQGEFFMMGDNRDNSNDSRYWGTLKMDLIKGHAMFLYWSW